MYRPGLSGSDYPCAGAGGTGFNTILPPNGPSCNSEDRTWKGFQRGNGIYSAGSYHPGIVQVCMVDGSVQVVNDTIDTGNLNAPTPTSGQSPYGIWGALGTRAAGEVVSSTDF